MMTHKQGNCIPFYSGLLRSFSRSRLCSYNNLAYELKSITSMDVRIYFTLPKTITKRGKYRNSFSCIYKGRIENGYRICVYDALGYIFTYMRETRKFISNKNIKKERWIKLSYIFKIFLGFFA